MNIEQLAEQADELADKKIGQPGEHHPDWHTVRDEIFAALVRNEALEDAAVKCEESADKLDSGKRVNQVDRHTAEVLRGRAATIRSMKGVKT